jgi:hypothetical protein
MKRADRKHIKLGTPRPIKMLPMPRRRFCSFIALAAMMVAMGGSNFDARPKSQFFVP